MAMVQQKAERRKARRLAKISSAPYTIPSRSTSSNQTPVTDSKADKSSTSDLMVTQSCIELKKAASPAIDHNIHQHCIEQVENTFLSAPSGGDIDMEAGAQSQQDGGMDSTTSETQLKTSVDETTEKIVEKMEVEVKKQEEAVADIKSSQEQQQQQDEQQKKQQQTAQADSEQDPAKMLSLNSGAVVA